MSCMQGRLALVTGGAQGIGAETSRRLAADTVVEELGGPEIVVNNKGVLRDNLLFKMTDDGRTTVLDAHLRGALLCTQAAQRHMVAGRCGRVVTMPSTSTLDNRGQANYAAAKAGRPGFIRTAATELEPSLKGLGS